MYLPDCRARIVLAVVLSSPPHLFARIHSRSWRKTSNKSSYRIKLPFPFSLTNLSCHRQTGPRVVPGGSGSSRLFCTICSSGSWIGRVNPLSGGPGPDSNRYRDTCLLYQTNCCLLFALVCYCVQCVLCWSSLPRIPFFIFFVNVVYHIQQYIVQTKK